MDSRHHGDEEGNAAGGFNLAACQFYSFDRQVFLSNCTAQSHFVLVRLQKCKSALERFFKLPLHRSRGTQLAGTWEYSDFEPVQADVGCTVNGDSIHGAGWQRVQADGAGAALFGYWHHNLVVGLLIDIREARFMKLGEVSLF